jgi:hypothetical protein
VPRYFSDQQIGDLNEGYSSIPAIATELLQLFMERKYANEKVKEYASHGLSRRIYSMTRCVDRVFEVLPPDRGTIPSREEVLDATVNIQAFVFNLFGFLENLAWIWVLQRPVTKEDGSGLDRRQVGLGERYKRVRASFSPTFSRYLDSRGEWFEHVSDFRDSLAHRVPLYIPPFTVHPDDAEIYTSLERQAVDALLKRDPDLYESLRAKQRSIERFQPLMLHSLNEGSKIVIFHPQLISDFSTIDEIARQLIAEMDRSGC